MRTLLYDDDEDEEAELTYAEALMASWNKRARETEKILEEFLQKLELEATAVPSPVGPMLPREFEPDPRFDNWIPRDELIDDASDGVEAFVRNNEGVHREYAPGELFGLKQVAAYQFLVFLYKHGWRFTKRDEARHTSDSLRTEYGVHFLDDAGYEHVKRYFSFAEAASSHDHEWPEFVATKLMHRLVSDWEPLPKQAENDERKKSRHEA